MKTVLDAVNEFKGVWPAGYIMSVNIDGAEVCYGEFNQCVEDCSNNFGKKAKPLYTKEFRVLGGTNEVWQKCKIVFTGKRYTVVENENGKEFSRKTAKIMIRDIDTRTDKEKSLDSLMDAYWDDNNEKLSRHSPIVITIYNAIKAGKIHNVTWSK